MKRTSDKTSTLNVGYPRTGRTTLMRGLAQRHAQMRSGRQQVVVVEEEVALLDGETDQEREAAVEEWRATTMRAAGFTGSWSEFWGDDSERILLYDLSDGANLGALMDALFPRTVAEAHEYRLGYPRKQASIFASLYLYRSSKLRDGVLDVIAPVNRISWSDEDEVSLFLDWWSDKLRGLLGAEELGDTRRYESLTPTHKNVDGILSFLYGDEPMHHVCKVIPEEKIRSVLTRCRGLYGSFDPVLMRSWLDKSLASAQWGCISAPARVNLWPAYDAACAEFVRETNARVNLPAWVETSMREVPVRRLCGALGPDAVARMEEVGILYQRVKNGRYSITTPYAQVYGVKEDNEVPAAAGWRTWPPGS